MKSKWLVLTAMLAVGIAGCRRAPVQKEKWVDNALDISCSQLKQTAEELSGIGKFPRSVHAGYDVQFLCRQLQREDTSFVDSLYPNPEPALLGKRVLCGVSDWTSGFFPGSLWYAYEMTGDKDLKRYAAEYTNLLYPMRKLTGTHDIGFMMNCSYGNALRLAPNDTIKAILTETADNLCARFNPEIGCIRSWDFGTWNYPVIIDNMMNLELLFNVYRLTGDKKYYDVAVKHAQTTMQNHFRPDCTSYHVVSYNDDGSVEIRQTHQGKNAESAWARGQAWGVYGYTVCYRETKEPVFLEQAVNIAEMIMNRVDTPDLIPYWDYDAPAGDETPRDASAAAITASALFELSTLLPDGGKYFDYAVSLLKHLSGPDYLAGKGTNQGFLLKHSTGSLPNGSEVDVPLNYADYYYLEAMVKYLKLKKNI